MSVFVTKADGTKEVFDPSKLVRSLVRAGADEGTAATIAQEVEGTLSEGISTSKIYRHAFAILARNDANRPAAVHYSLKRALMGLGPSGFPFETYISEIFKAKGYTTAVGQMVRGRCATHEVDVLAKKGNETIAIEMKFHNNLAMKSDLKVVLYVHARVEDLKKSGAVTGGILLTNTKFTSEAISYAACAGLALISWGYPEKGNLNDLIRETMMYPITGLTTLTKSEKDRLINNKVVLCNSLLKNTSALETIGLKPGQTQRVLSESQMLCLPGGEYDTHRYAE